MVFTAALTTSPLARRDSGFGNIFGVSVGGEPSAVNRRYAPNPPANRMLTNASVSRTLASVMRDPAFSDLFTACMYDAASQPACHSGNYSVGMGLAPILVPEKGVWCPIMQAQPDGGKPHPYSRGGT